MEIKSIIAWGDSILKGAVSNGETKDFEILEENCLAIVARDLGLEVTNKSVYGATIEKLQHVQQKNMRALLSAEIGIIEAGDNDCDYDWGEVCQNVAAGKQNVEAVSSKCPPAQFERILAEMVATARENKITPVIMTPPPLVADRWFKNICIGNNEKFILEFLNNDVQNLYQTQMLYALSITKTAARLGVQLLDMRKEFLAQNEWRALMCKDGIHPNAEGHKFMAEIWKNKIPNLKKEF